MKRKYKIAQYNQIRSSGEIHSHALSDDIMMNDISLKNQNCGRRKSVSSCLLEHHLNFAESTYGHRGLSVHKKQAIALLVLKCI
ncbi:hypothetical protein YC2023_014241 [Brassica napus]